MEIVYTLHARKMLKQRKIEPVWVIDTITSLEKITHDSGKYYARKRLNARTLEVCYQKEKNIKIITAYWI